MSSNTLFADGVGGWDAVPFGLGTAGDSRPTGYPFRAAAAGVQAWPWLMPRAQPHQHRRSSLLLAQISE